MTAGDWFLLAASAVLLLTCTAGLYVRIRTRRAVRKIQAAAERATRIAAESHDV